MTTEGTALSFLIMLLFVAGFCYLVYWAVKKGGKNYPTWRGIIISALLGMLPLYLILCFFGVMGEERDYE